MRTTALDADEFERPVFPAAAVAASVDIDPAGPECARDVACGAGTVDQEEPIRLSPALRIRPSPSERTEETLRLRKISKPPEAEKQAPQVRGWLRMSPAGGTVVAPPAAPTIFAPAC